MGPWRARTLVQLVVAASPTLFAPGLAQTCAEGASARQVCPYTLGA